MGLREVSAYRTQWYYPEMPEEHIVIVFVPTSDSEWRHGWISKTHETANGNRFEGGEGTKSDQSLAQVFCKLLAKTGEWERSYQSMPLSAKATPSTYVLYALSLCYGLYVSTSETSQKYTSNTFRKAVLFLSRSIFKMSKCCLLLSTEN